MNILLNITRSRVSDGHQFIKVIKKDKKVIMFIRASVEKRDEIYSIDLIGVIHGVIVHPAYQRKGIAKILVGKALEWLKSKDVNVCELYVVTKNKIALTAWESLGFQIYQHRMLKKF